MGLLVNIDVGDLASGERFYTAALGLTVGRRLGDDCVELLGLEVPVYLLQKNAGSLPFSTAAQGRSYQRHWTPVHLDVAVDDLDAAVTRAQAAGATLEQPVRTAAWGRLAVLADPFGHGFCLLQFSGRGYDALLSG